jgi:hypothetical protein
MIYRHNITINDKPYNAVAAMASHNGRGVLISISADGAEAGCVKMIASIPDTLIKWSHLDDDQFIQEAWSQFEASELAGAALSKWPVLLEIKMQ